MKMQRVRCDSLPERGCSPARLFFLPVCLVCLSVFGITDSERRPMSEWVIPVRCDETKNGLWRRSSVKLFAAAHVFHAFIYFVLPLWQIIRGGHRVPKIESNPPDVNLLFSSFPILTIAPCLCLPLPSIWIPNFTFVDGWFPALPGSFKRCSGLQSFELCSEWSFLGEVFWG